MYIKKLIRSSLLQISIPLLLFLYVGIRAYTLSFTHDESLSFTIIEGSQSFEFTANNHYLNTLLMSFCKDVFGVSEFSLRLPNVFSFIFYAIGGLLVFIKSKDVWLQLLGITLFFFNPFLLDFFSLARGYGLSLGFLSMSLYFLVKNENHYGSISPLIFDFIFSLLFASLAIYANLALINYYISVQILFILKFWFFRKNHFITVTSSIFFSIIFLISLRPLKMGVLKLLELKDFGQLYYGTSNFWEGYENLIQLSISALGDTPKIVFTIIALLVIVFFFSAFFVIRLRKFDSTLFLITTLVFLLVVAVLLENLFFDAKFPTERTALYYLPILAMLVYHLFIVVKKQFSLYKTSNLLMVFVVFFVVGNFIKGVNFTSTKSWKYDSHTKDAMKIIREATLNSTEQVSISVDWLFEPAVKYYIQLWDLPIEASLWNGTDENHQFVYRINDYSTLDSYVLLQKYEDIGSELMMKQKSGD